MVNSIPTFEGNQVSIDDEGDVEYLVVRGKCFMKLKNEYFQAKLMDNK